MFLFLELDNEIIENSGFLPLLLTLDFLWNDCTRLTTQNSGFSCCLMLLPKGEVHRVRMEIKHKIWIQEDGKSWDTFGSHLWLFIFLIGIAGRLISHLLKIVSVLASNLVSVLCLNHVLHHYYREPRTCIRYLLVFLLHSSEEIFEVHWSLN